MPNTKIATCCYCGTRAALVLRGTDRHELSCSTCGAPLHEMKMLRSETPRRAEPKRQRATPRLMKKPVKSYKKKRRKSLGAKIFEEVWDVVEDIFD